MFEIPSRRRFIFAAAGAAVGLVGSRPSEAAVATPRVLRLNHLHTGEKLEIEYWRAGAYEPDSLGVINHLMRDFRTGDIHPIDPSLLDLLHSLSRRTETRRPFEIISAYRSPVTNAALRSHSSGVASSSLHLKGKAIDIRLADVPLKQLRKAALACRRGGVGYYPSSDFIHVDTGRLRFW